MKNMKMKLMAGLVSGLVAAPMALLAADAAAPTLTASLDLPVLSAYVWRGQVLNDEAVVQPSATISKAIGPGTLTLNYWQSFNLTDRVTGDSMEFSEHDVTASYAFTCPLTGAGITLGIVNYDFPNQSIVDTNGSASVVSDTREAYVSIGFGDCPLAPTLAVYYDFNAVDGFYGNFSVGHGFELVKDSLTLNLGASIGAGSSDYNGVYFGKEDEALNDGNLTASLAYKVSDSITITPAVQYTYLLDSGIRDSIDESGAYYGDTDIFVASIKAGITF